MSDDHNIIPIARSRGPLMRSKRARYSAPDGGSYCQAHAFVLDQNDLSIQCQTCKRFFEPFSALLYLCQRWDKYGQQLSVYGAELKAIGEERDTLSKEIANLKAAGRRLGGTDSALNKLRDEIAFLKVENGRLRQRWEEIPPTIKRQITAMRRAPEGT